MTAHKWHKREVNLNHFWWSMKCTHRKLVNPDTGTKDYYAQWEIDSANKTAPQKKNVYTLLHTLIHTHKALL
jgi:hypothetical protein